MTISPTQPQLKPVQLTSSRDVHFAFHLFCPLSTALFLSLVSHLDSLSNPAVETPGPIFVSFTFVFHSVASHLANERLGYAVSFLRHILLVHVAKKDSHLTCHSRPSFYFFNPISHFPYLEIGCKTARYCHAHITLFTQFSFITMPCSDFFA